MYFISPATPTVVLAPSTSPGPESSARLPNPTSCELKDYFGQLLVASRPNRSAPTTRKQLTGIGESLTSEEAMERLEQELEEKKRKEKEKKKTGKNKRKKLNTCEDQQQSKVMCIECETLYDMDDGDG